MSDKQTLTCIICPESCALTVENGKVTGNTCKRGEKFAQQELISPERILTTTVKVIENKVTRRVPVKSEKPVSLKQLPELMRQIHRLCLTAAPGVGETISCGIPEDSLTLIITGK